MDKITEMDLDFLVNESVQSEGILGTIYYSEIKVEPDSETSTDTDASQNDVEEPQISTETDEDFQLHGSSTDANVSEVSSREIDKSVQLRESCINTNVNELVTNMKKETNKDLLQDGSIHADKNKVTTKKGDKEICSGESSVDCNSSVSQNNIAKNNVNTVLAVVAEEYQLPMIKFTTLLKLREQSKKERVEFCMELGLLASKFICSLCENDMALKKKEIGDGYLWVCRGGNGKKSHRKVCKSVRNGSFFTNTKLSLLDTLMILHCWVYKLPRQWITLELDVTKCTLTDWFDICRDICVEICARDNSKIGGKGAIVEIEGGKYERRKNDVNIQKNSFVFIGTENMYGDKTFLNITEKCDKNSFLEVIKSYVLPGSTVISEYCSLFKCRRDWDFVNLAKSCKYKFKDPKSSDLLKRKSFWNVIKRKLPMHKKDYGFDHHIAEFLWRKRNYSAYDKMRRFLLHLKTIYPPPTIDG